VRRALYTALHLEPSHDFQFLYDGEAYAVGDVLIEHGNRYTSGIRSTTTVYATCGPCSRVAKRLLQVL
jgi:hypothetical protein